MSKVKEGLENEVYSDGKWILYIPKLVGGVSCRGVYAYTGDESSGYQVAYRVNHQSRGFISI